MSATTEHTKEPWKVVNPGHGHDTEYLCVQIGRDRSYTTLELKPEDARRIVACVNACASIPNPHVALPKLIEALRYVLQRIKDSDQWWMDSPTKGGFEVDKLTEALAGVSK